MIFKFSCPSCGQHLSATAGDCGTTGWCPGCQQAIPVPDSHLATQPGAPSAGEAAPKRALRQACLALGLVLLPGGLLIGLTSGRLVLSAAQLKLLTSLFLLAAVVAVIFAHRIFRRAAGHSGARVVAVFSLIFGYLSAVLLLLVALAAQWGAIVIQKAIIEPPDFVAEGGDGLISGSEEPVRPSRTPPARK